MDTSKGSNTVDKLDTRRGAVQEKTVAVDVPQSFNVWPWVAASIALTAGVPMILMYRKLKKEDSRLRK